MEVDCVVDRIEGEAGKYKVHISGTCIVVIRSPSTLQRYAWLNFRTEAYVIRLNIYIYGKSRDGKL